MVRSMTGYGKGQFSDQKRNVVVEIKSVNNRYLDMNSKISRKYAFAEEEIKSIVKKQIARGKIEIAVQVENLQEQEMIVTTNAQLAKEYLSGLEKIKAATGISQVISVEYLAGLPEVMVITPPTLDEEEIRALIAKATENAVAKFVEMSEIEGGHLANDIIARTKIIAGYLEIIESKASELAPIYKEKLRKRIKVLIEGEVEISEDRISLEAAVIADKASITEEVVRLKSHLKQAKKVLLDEEMSKGKKIDFLVQEMNRETNTIGSKANDLEITNLMIEMKSEVEKIREQIQNIQ